MQEATEYLKIARSTLYRWEQEGRLVLYRLGNKTVRVRKSELNGLGQPNSTRRSQSTSGTLVTPGSAVWKLVGLTAGPADLAAKHDWYLAQALEGTER